MKMEKAPVGSAVSRLLGTKCHLQPDPLQSTWGSSGDSPGILPTCKGSLCSAQWVWLGPTVLFPTLSTATWIMFLCFVTEKSIYSQHHFDAAGAGQNLPPRLLCSQGFTLV